MRIETERLVIRHFTEEDVEALYAIKYDPEILKYNPDFLERDIKKERITDFIHKFLQADESGTFEEKRTYAVTLLSDGKVVGAVSISKNSILQEYELGWKTMKEYTGNGYASEAGAALCEYVCAACKVDYMIVVMDTDNPASYHTALKSGFRLFEKRKVYDYSYQNYGDDYYYFRRYYSKSLIKEKFYGDASYQGRGSQIDDVRSYPELIMIRGNSGSGKSTVARMLQKKLGRGTLMIPQDVVRRELVWVKDRPKNKAINLIQDMLLWGYQNSSYTILEGILYSKDYIDVFQTAIENFGLHIHAYYYDLSFEETLARHLTKPNREEFGEEEMREWFCEHDLIPNMREKMITAEQSAEETTAMILKDMGMEL